jgi:hypothetical protein
VDVINGAESQAMLLIEMTTADLPDFQLLYEMAQDLNSRGEQIKAYIERYSTEVSEEEMNTLLETIDSIGTAIGMFEDVRSNARQMIEESKKATNAEA